VTFEWPLERTVGFEVALDAPGRVIARGAVAVAAVLLGSALVLTGCSSNGSTATPTLANSSLQTTVPSARPEPAQTGPAVVGDITDQAVGTAVTRRLDAARRVRFVRNKFSYQARAVMVDTLTDGTDSAPPGFHKLIFAVELNNLQSDRPAPLPPVFRTCAHRRRSAR